MRFFNSKEQWKEPLPIVRSKFPPLLGVKMGYLEMAIQVELDLAVHYFQTSKQTKSEKCLTWFTCYIFLHLVQLVLTRQKSPLSAKSGSSKARVEASFWCTLLHSRPWLQSMHQQHEHLGPRETGHCWDDWYNIGTGLSCAMATVTRRSKCPACSQTPIVLHRMLPAQTAPEMGGTV